MIQWELGQEGILYQEEIQPWKMLLLEDLGEVVQQLSSRPLTKIIGILEIVLEPQDPGEMLSQIEF